MEKKAIDKKKDTKNSETAPVSIKQLIKGLKTADGSSYSVMIEDEKTKTKYSGPTIPRIRRIEEYCEEKNSMWPLEVYCGIRTVELDRDIRHGQVFLSRLVKVTLHLLNQYSDIGLSDVEKVLRWGESNIYVIARPPAKVGKVEGIINNGRGEKCEWFYELVNGIPEVRKSFKAYDCESFRENMDRLEKAGHITLNYEEVTAEMTRLRPETMQKKMNQFGKKQLEQKKEKV